MVWAKPKALWLRLLAQLNRPGIGHVRSRIMFVWLGLLSANAAWAQPAPEPQPQVAAPPASPSPPPGPGAMSRLSVSVYVDGKADKPQREWLLDRLARLGEDASALDVPGLASCRSAGCLAEYAEPGRRLLLVHVTSQGSSRYFVEGFLKSPSDPAAQIAQSACEDCSPENLRSLVGDLAARVLTEPTPPASPHPAGASSSLPLASTPPGQPGQPATSGERSAATWTPRRIVTVASLSLVTGLTAGLTLTLAIAGLGPGKTNVALLPDKPGPEMTWPNDLPNWSTVSLVLTGTAVSILSGVSLALVWPESRRTPAKSQAAASLPLAPGVLP